MWGVRISWWFGNIVELMIFTGSTQLKKCSGKDKRPLVGAIQPA